jgi:hypothetical protein
LTAGISAGVSLATTGAQIWMNSIQLSHNADTATTLIVNGLAQQFTNLKNAYFAEPNVTCADQRAVLDAFDAAIVWLQSPQACGNPNYGAAGNRCVSERVTPGAKYSYIDYYRTPIANDLRLAAAGCDTGQTVYLPSLTTGQYQNIGITDTGGSATSGATAAQIASEAVANTSQPTGTLAATSATAPNYLLIAAAALGAVLLAKAL